jgi:type I restriction enzyme, S subunit
LRFSEFSDRWVEKKLQDFFLFKNGINAPNENYGRGYKFINVLYIINNNFITHDKIFDRVDISEEIFNKSIVEYGDILFQLS